MNAQSDEAETSSAAINRDVDLEATELEPLSPLPPPALDPETVHAGTNVFHNRQSSSIRSPAQDVPTINRAWHSICAWWSQQVRITVSHEHNRDHFANERTFLGYLRTSLAFAVLGVIVAQLFRLQHAPNPNARLGFFVVGKPLAAACVLSATVIALLGAFRFWRQQNAMARGKCQAGGWEVYLVGVLGLLITMTVFILVLAISIDKGVSPVARSVVN